MTEVGRVGVIGARGFIGSALIDGFRSAGYEVSGIPFPRLTATSAEEAVSIRLSESEERALVTALAQCQVIVNAAGNPDASSREPGVLTAANARLPIIAYELSARAGVSRFIHVSSAVVQGDCPVLDDSAHTRPFSAYSMSKTMGERWLLDVASDALPLTIYRPPSVHAPDRRITRSIQRLARRGLLSIAKPGTGPTPQALKGNVIGAVIYLALSPMQPPLIVHHPWEGLSCESFLEALTGSKPHRVPRSLARAVVTSLRQVEFLSSSISANRRRLELLWFGQGVAQSWLERVEWKPPLGLEEWRSLRHGR